MECAQRRGGSRFEVGFQQFCCWRKLSREVLVADSRKLGSEFFFECALGAMWVYVDVAYVECGYAAIPRRAYECMSVPWGCGERCGAVLCCCNRNAGLPEAPRNVTSVSARTHPKHRESPTLEAATSVLGRITAVASSCSGLGRYNGRHHGCLLSSPLRRWALRSTTCAPAPHNHRVLRICLK
jgi:hypothetical protein